MKRLEEGKGERRIGFWITKVSILFYLLPRDKLENFNKNLVVI